MALEKLIKFLLCGPFPQGAAGGLLINIFLSTTAMATGLVFGLLIALGRTSRFGLLSRVCAAFVEIVRALPLILIMFWFVLTIPLMAGKPMPALFTSFLALFLYSSVNQAEIIRSGLMNIDKGQWQVAACTGLSRFQCLIHVILPQMFQKVLPSYVGFFISIFKDTSIVTMVGLIDLTYAGVMITQKHPSQMFETYFLMAVIFFVICFALSRLAKRLELRNAQRFGNY